MNRLLVSTIPLSYLVTTRIHMRLTTNSPRLSFLGLRVSKRKSKCRQLPYEDEYVDQALFIMVRVAAETMALDRWTK
jgi:hypothetical protein